MKKKLVFILCIVLTFYLVGCSKQSNNSEKLDVLTKTNEEIVDLAKGSTVNFYGYGGNEVMNKWFDTYVVSQMKQKYDINVKRVGMDIDNILNQLLSEKQAGSSKGNIDVIWINGENFKTAKENDLLFGPFTNKLSNYEKYVDKSSEDITTDFGTNVDSMEAPWGKSQFAMVTDTSKISSKINNTETLKKVIQENPGKFTYPSLPDFTGSAFVRNVIYDIVGYENVASLPEDKAKIKQVIQPAIDYLNEIKPYLWNKGKTYPATTSQLDNMFSDNETYFTMTYSPNQLMGRVANGEFSKNTKVIEFDKGNISNTHFLTIPKNSQNEAGAIVLIDYLMSIDAQGSKTEAKNWGDTTVLDMKKVPTEDKSKFKETIAIEKTVPELKAGLVPIIEKIWLEEVLEGEK
ncbi:ABC transporter substrate-binding protein [Romboutsia maritimum]|uniref:ABC transporter substrate-binding protein n=1 Tax=Romboutsia maritimum TaxID=2020948 RepID=A0A371ITB3_9FIRM|nr:ABC transporter substrate-binding protein [Romboutsia maritimum]RDY23699.1 ABC transporter substrate-binding protein [Romboutsia maritimum]